MRRWRQGCYTLVHDTDSEGQEFALDAVFYCGCQGWQQDYGGYTSYIARGEDEELLTVNPAENSLALVYRDKDTLRFIKHVNARIKDMPDSPEFYDISLTYFEWIEDDLSNDDRNDFVFVYKFPNTCKISNAVKPWADGA